MKKAIALMMTLAMVTGLAACGSSGKDTAAAGQQDTVQQENAGALAEEGSAGESAGVVVGLAHDPQNIGPFQGMSAGRIGILYTVYEFLVTSDGGEMKGVMMKDYEKIDDLTYHCEIYDYIYDQDGNHITAADVAWSYQSGIDSGNLPKLGSIESVEAVSDYVVRFKFTNLAIGDLGALWMECPVVSQKAYEESEDQMATKPVTTSAYRCTEFMSGSKMVFENTGNYWQKEESLIHNCSKHNTDRVEFDIITDASQLTNALKTGAIDVTCWLSDTDIPDFENVEGFAVSPIPDNTTYCLVYNCDAQNGVFADKPELRKALAYAVDNEQLVAGALGGNGFAAKTWGNTNYSDYVDAWLQEDYYDADPAKAKEMLAAAGGEGMTLRMMVQSGDINTKIATIVQAQLQQIGVNTEISTFDTQLFNEYKYNPNEWDLMIDQGGSTSYLVNVWKLGWDAAGYSHGGGENFVKDAKLQSLMEDAMDMEKHGDAAMDAFHQYLKEQCYGIGLVQSCTNIAHSDKIKEIVVDARGQVTPGACIY